jgi:hypothetical protein
MYLVATVCRQQFWENRNWPINFLREKKSGERSEDWGCELLLDWVRFRVSGTILQQYLWRISRSHQHTEGVVRYCKFCIREEFSIRGSFSANTINCIQNPHAQQLSRFYCPISNFTSFRYQYWARALKSPFLGRKTWKEARRLQTMLDLIQ